VHLLSSTSIKRLFKDKASRGQIATQAAQPKQRESLMVSKRSGVFNKWCEWGCVSQITPTPQFPLEKK
tara:strand:- start:323 stop:526 length:204 start_codon:yes stop_codon:yes gene_type:complete